jgi:hypothetical protein
MRFSAWRWPADVRFFNKLPAVALGEGGLTVQLSILAMAGAIAALRMIG